MSNTTAEVIADSIGPNGKRVTSILTVSPYIVHAEFLRHRLFSFSVASARAMSKGILEQVKSEPFVPEYFPKTHSGMQGTEVFKDLNNLDEIDDLSSENIKEIWLWIRDDAVRRSEEMKNSGVSKQIYNRIVMPWVMTRCVVTSTEWDNFFRLRHPWHTISGSKTLRGQPEILWEDEVNLNFPAEYNIQALSIELRKALLSSTPTELKAGEYHLPFITDKEKSDLSVEQQCKISMSRNAMTSYNVNKGRSIEMELNLAGRLIKEHHWSPAEHIAMAIDVTSYTDVTKMPTGLELRMNNKKEYAYWSRNFQNWVQYRAQIDS